MIEALIVIFAVGFVIYYMIRHPLRSVKRILQGLAIFALGVLGIGLFIALIFGGLTLFAAV